MEVEKYKQIEQLSWSKGRTRKLIKIKKALIKKVKLFRVTVSTDRERL